MTFHLTANRQLYRLRLYIRRGVRSQKCTPTRTDAAGGGVPKCAPLCHISPAAHAQFGFALNICRNATHMSATACHIFASVNAVRGRNPKIEMKLTCNFSWYRSERERATE
ncbi:hypothetical protein EVAR_37445_1 [Eumeta japonica]|uniref:Uncharacterized protein n=1 Tax=Eumeta variegata TaxID=151549 RepID=A0A4C1X2G7_EUMVA|nr:hypothetical protein EVAR_37445_1 [Eumeta japonica]